MILLIKRIYKVYQIEKVKKLFREKKYKKSLSILNSVKFKNCCYFYTMKGALLYFLKDFHNSLLSLDKAILYSNKEDIYNLDEYKYLKAYVYYLKALIYKEKKEKELSYKMINEYNNCQFIIDNVRSYLVEDFPLEFEKDKK